MKKAKNMTNPEFQNEKRKAENRPLSKFGRFAKELRGLEVYRLKKRVYPYELFHFYQKRCLKDLEFNPYYKLKTKNNEQ